jgi:adenylate kinase family enzyme
LVALALWDLVAPPVAPVWTAPPAPELARLAQAVAGPVPLVLLWVAGDAAAAEPATLAPRTRHIAAGAELAHELGRCLIADELPLVEAADDDALPLSIPAAYPGPVVVLARRANVALRLGERPLLVHRVQPLPVAQRARQWSQALDLPDTPAAAAWAQRLARQLPLDTTACEQAAADARLAAALAGHAPGETELLAAARHRAALRVQGTVDLRPARATLADLVLADAALGVLQRALRLYAAQPELGLRLLLAGAPGTGKTLAAEALAAQLGRDLLVVDAGRVLSKWLGETERNLERAFQAAEDARALLFIDEADALFARRTEVKDAHDRYANAETAYLLQRLERFSGVLVLASNARGAIDAAFTRRFDAVVAFDEPDEAARCRLWQQYLGALATAPLNTDEACALLAQWYPLTGAQIRGACRAAAAEQGSGLQPLLSAIAREFHKAGRAYPGLPTLS